MGSGCIVSLSLASHHIPPFEYSLIDHEAGCNDDAKEEEDDDKI